MTIEIRLTTKTLSGGFLGIMEVRKNGDLLISYQSGRVCMTEDAAYADAIELCKRRLNRLDIW